MTSTTFPATRGPVYIYTFTRINGLTGSRFTWVADLTDEQADAVVEREEAGWNNPAQVVFARGSRARRPRR